MRYVLPILATVLLTTSNSALAGENFLTCNATRIVIEANESLELIMVTDTIPVDTLIGWSSSPDNKVTIFCDEGKLTFVSGGNTPIRVVLSPQEGATVEK